MLALQKELDDARETRSREKEREARRAQEDEEELQILRDRCETLEEERVNGGARVRIRSSHEPFDIYSTHRLIQRLSNNSNQTWKVYCWKSQTCLAGTMNL